MKKLIIMAMCLATTTLFAEQISLLFILMK